MPDTYLDNGWLKIWNKTKNTYKKKTELQMVQRPPITIFPHN